MCHDEEPRRRSQTDVGVHPSSTTRPYDHGNVHHTARLVCENKMIKCQTPSTVSGVQIVANSRGLLTELLLSVFSGKASLVQRLHTPNDQFRERDLSHPHG